MKNPSIHNLSERVLLCILDGFGENPKDLKNAILHAEKPTIDSLRKSYPYTTIQSGGEAVGLPKGVAGNSEVGHLNLGAGRPVRQDLVRINEAIELNTFKDMPRFKELLELARKNKKVHLLGLLSDGGVHSHINHLKHILDLLKQESIKVYLHAFMDGRDTPKTNGPKYIEEIISHGGCTIASLQGRSIGMDRDRRWEKIESAVKMLTGVNGVTKLDPLSYIQSEYVSERFDEFITPALFDEDGKIQSDDAVFFFNFRPDRAKQISLAFNDRKFSEFKINVHPKMWLCMSPYLQDELPELPILFDKEKIQGTLAEFISQKNLKQFKIAETEKYAHVTYFFNGGEEQPFKGEERVLVNSPREVATYDLKPEMSAPEVCSKLIDKLSQKDITLYVVNFANCDMVGHTGNYEATLKAVSAVDQCIKSLVEKCSEENITMLITADHGNADQMVYDDGSPHTSHSDADVPFFVIHPKLKNQNLLLNSKVRTAALKDVAPTILAILNINQPESITGEALFL
jgi:2,3-bisphosphoglycerate-independent phosphoglycerate mutase